MQPTLSIEALIFDFDGLVIDTESPAYEAWSAIYAEHGVELELHEWVKCVGGSLDGGFDPVTHLESLTGQTLDREALVADKKARKHDRCMGLPLLPGVKERVDEARSLGLHVAVASSSSRGWVTTHLERLGLAPLIDGVKSRNDVERVKPDPELYLAAAAHLGVDPARCLVFEDSRNGVIAAKAAGMTCYAVPNPITRGADFAEADRICGSLEEVSLQDLVEGRPESALGGESR